MPGMLRSTLGKATGRIVEYRCRIGHAYSPLAVREAYEEAVEGSLRHAMVTLLEAARLEDHLAPELGSGCVQNAQTRRDQAEVIRRLLERPQQPR